MRILHINCNYIGTALHQLLIEKLDALGHDNEVFVPTYDANISIIEPNKNVCVLECFNRWDRLVFDYKQAKIIKAIEEHYDVKSFDLIHAYTLFTDGNCARFLSKKYGIPFVVAVRNTDVNSFFKKMFFLRSRGVDILVDAKKVFFLSTTYQNTVLDNYVPSKIQRSIYDKSIILPNGINDFWLDNVFCEEKQISKGKIKLLYVGIVSKNKNISTTQRAMKLLKEKGYEVSLTVVGKIVDKSEYENLKSDKDISFLSPKNKEELIYEYRKHDIFIMPSISETFGLVYAEAMSQGLPILYSKGQGFDGQFPNGTVGFAVACNSEIEIANSIINILDNYAKISNNCKRYVDRFNWHSIAKQYDIIYNELLKKSF